MSSIVNKVKDAIHSDKSSSHHSGQPEGTHGTHNNRAANAADPRIDSDRDNRAAHHTTTTTTGAAGTTGLSSNDNYTYGSEASRTDGPHSSNLANKADPRVDSDRDYSRNMGANPSGSANVGGTGAGVGAMGAATHGTTHSNTHGTTTGVTGGGLHQGGLHQGGLHQGGLHQSGEMGATHGGVVPTAADGSTAVPGRTGGHGFDTADTAAARGTHSGMTGSGLHEGATGPHSGRVANAADPRVDSDLDGSRNIGGTTGHSTTAGGVGGMGHTTGHSTTAGGMGGVAGTTGHTTGPAANTAGPHKSDMMNKADPRVDSNLDGSKTMGGDKTFSNAGTHAHRDPTDATQAPPSVLQKHVGGPVVEHDDHTHDREKRHSVSHQEQHRGF